MVKRLTVVFGLVFLITAVFCINSWWISERSTGTYTTQEAEAARDLVQEYYSRLVRGQYDQAFKMVFPPSLPEKALSEWRAQRVKLLEERTVTGDYQPMAVITVFLIGDAHERPRSEPLRFYVSMDIDRNGTKDAVVEIVSVKKVHGHLSIMGLESTDLFINNRVYGF